MKGPNFCGNASHKHASKGLAHICALRQLAEARQIIDTQIKIERGLRQMLTRKDAEIFLWRRKDIT